MQIRLNEWEKKQIELIAEKLELEVGDVITIAARRLVNTLAPDAIDQILEQWKDRLNLVGCNRSRIDLVLKQVLIGELEKNLTEREALSELDDLGDADTEWTAEV